MTNVSTPTYVVLKMHSEVWVGFLNREGLVAQLVVMILLTFGVDNIVHHIALARVELHLPVVLPLGELAGLSYPVVLWHQMEMTWFCTQMRHLQISELILSGKKKQQWSKNSPLGNCTVYVD